MSATANSDIKSLPAADQRFRSEILKSAAFVGVLALTAIGLDQVSMSHVGDMAMTSVGAVAFSGRFVMNKINSIMSERTERQVADTHSPELANQPWLLRMVVRAQESSAFARFENGHWLVKDYGTDKFEVMDEAAYQVFKERTTRTYGALTEYILTSPSDALEPTFAMIRYEGKNFAPSTEDLPTVLSVNKGRVVQMTPPSSP